MIPVIFPSAAVFWLNYHSQYNLDPYSLDQRSVVSVPDIFDLSVDDEQKQILTELFQEQLPVTVLSPPRERKYYNNKVVKAMKHPAHLPPNGFVRITDQIYMATPELCFLQAAGMLNFERLVLFGNDLCGKFIHDETSEFKQRPRKPVTSAQSIQEFLEHAQGCYGHRAAVRAAKYIMDNSNSHRESMLAFFSRVPSSRGGYALPLPGLNERINLSEEGIHIMHGHECFGDMVWSDAKIVVEYDSDISHLTSYQHRKDKQRTSAITVSGYRTMIITKADVASLSAMDETFRTLRRLLEMPSIDNALEKYIHIRKNNLASFRDFKSYDPRTY